MKTTSYFISLTSSLLPKSFKVSWKPQCFYGQTVYGDKRHSLASRAYLPGSHHELTLKLDRCLHFCFPCFLRISFMSVQARTAWELQWEATLVNFFANLLASVPKRFAFLWVLLLLGIYFLIFCIFTVTFNKVIWKKCLYKIIFCIQLFNT